MSDRWGEILNTAPVDSCTWAVLPENGWGAIVAYRVGPGHARPHHVPLKHRRVTETCTEADGSTQRRSVPMSVDDLAEIKHWIDSYLAAVGLPPAPHTWWEIAPPPGMAGNEFVKLLEDACGERVTATGGVEVAEQYAAVLTDEIRTVFLRPPPPTEDSGGTARAPAAR